MYEQRFQANHHKMQYGSAMPFLLEICGPKARILARNTDHLRIAANLVGDMQEEVLGGKKTARLEKWLEIYVLEQAQAYWIWFTTPVQATSMS